MKPPPFSMSRISFRAIQPIAAQSKGPRPFGSRLRWDFSSNLQGCFQNRTRRFVSPTASLLSLQSLGGNASAYRGFTLIELLVVMAIILALSALIVPTVAGFLGGSQLSQSAQMAIDQLSLARQSALSLNRPVEVRFYQFGDPQIPGEKSSDPSTGRYRSIQSFEILDSGSAIALGKVQSFPNTVIIDRGSDLSSIVGLAKDYSSTPALMTDGGQTLAIPRVGTHYNSVSFRFLPDGSARLSPSSQRWFLTLHGAQPGDTLKIPPANFYTIQINASNGHIQTFRP